MKTIILLLLPFLCFADKSITGADNGYLKTCHQAATNDQVFARFRSNRNYSHILELPGGEPFARYIRKHCSHMKHQFPLFEKLDTIGNPPRRHFQKVGMFSGTTLRYIAIAHHIDTLFDLPANPLMAEIGAGFGGQCYILSLTKPFHSYYIYDLDEPEELMARVHRTLGVHGVHYLKTHEHCPATEIDLLISNYAFSECDRKTQLDYFERVIKHADRGYMIYNQIARNVYGLDSLTPRELYDLLAAHGMQPKIEKELINTYQANVLITWDRTR